jgi:hypothetical protein
MIIRTHRTFCAGFVLFSLFLPALLPLAARAQSNLQTEEKKDKGKKKDEKPKLTREEKEYQKIKRFSQELLQKDADFREGVEDAFTLMNLRRARHFHWSFRTWGACE